MSVIKSGSILALSTLAKIVGGLVIIKLMAWKLSPEEFGTLGQLMTAVAIVGMFAGGGISNGVIKLLASAQSKPDYLKVLNSAMAICLASTGLIALVLLISAQGLSSFVFGAPGYSAVFVCLAAAQILIGLNNLLLSVFTSQGKLWRFSLINILGTCLGLMVFIYLIYSGGYNATAYALVFLPAASGIFSLFAIRGTNLFKFTEIRAHCDPKTVKRLLSYSIVMLVAVSVMPIAQMLSRNYLGARAGWTEVGYWQGVLKISDVYMQFIGIVLINYALPRFSRCNSQADMIIELKRVLVPLLGVTIAGLLTVYAVKTLIIRLLFSEKFMPMEEFFLPQLIGDCLRTIASTITYAFLAKDNKLVPIGSEIFQGVSFFTFTVLLYPIATKVAPVYAHLCTYLFLAIMMGFCLLFRMKTQFVKPLPR